MTRLSGKVAIVTGGARGMGAQTCRLFVQEGARVVSAGVRGDEGRGLASELGDAAVFMPLDVSEGPSWRSLVEQTVERFGIIGRIGPFHIERCRLAIAWRIPRKRGIDAIERGHERLKGMRVAADPVQQDHGHGAAAVAAQI